MRPKKPISLFRGAVDARTIDGVDPEYRKLLLQHGALLNLRMR